MSSGFEHSPVEVKTLTEDQSSPSTQPSARHAATRVGTTPRTFTLTSWTNSQNGLVVGDAVEECDGGSIDEGSVDQPGSHHPAQAGGPGHHVSLPNVLMQTSVGGALDGSQVGERNGLWLARGPRGEQNIDGVVGIARHRAEDIVVTQEIVPRKVSVPQRPGEPSVSRHHDRHRRAGLQHPGVKGQLPGTAQNPVLGKEDLGFSDSEPGPDLRCGKALGNGQRNAARLDDTQVDGHGLDVHGHVDGDRIAPIHPQAGQCVGDAVREESSPIRVKLERGLPSL